MTSVPSEDVARKFEAAWNVFAATCAQFIAPEPTYQAWFAHYVISQFGIDRVAREPMVKKAAFDDSVWKGKVLGDHVRLDIVVMSQPGVHLPHYANSIDRAADGTGLQRLWDMAVISELKVTATQGGGQSHTEVARDAYKLSMLLDELERSAPGRALAPPGISVRPRQPPSQALQQGGAASPLREGASSPECARPHRRLGESAKPHSLIAATQVAQADDRESGGVGFSSS